MAADAAQPPAGHQTVSYTNMCLHSRNRRGGKHHPANTRSDDAAALVAGASGESARPDLAGAVEELDLAQPDAVAVAALPLRELETKVLSLRRRLSAPTFP